MICPLCSGAVQGGELIRVCNPCHLSVTEAQSLEVQVNRTGEFPALTQVSTAAHQGSERPIIEANHCAWCSKGERDVKKLLGRMGVALCNECVALCINILDAELGDWR
jgi:hypothetical protein